MRRICKGFPCSSPLQAVNFCVKFAKSGVKRVIGQVVAVLENSKIPGQAEVVPALAAAGIRYFRALPVEVILFGIRARSADNFCFISLVDGFIPGQFEPLPGGFLRFRKKGGDVPFGAFVRVEDGIEAIAATGLKDVKFNCVPIAGVNEAELPELVARFTRERPWKFRFIELMPIGCAYEAGLRGLPMAEARSSLEAAFGPLRPVLPERGVHGPAVYYQAAGSAGQIGFIDAMEHQFCSSCNRVRLTAEGFLKLCLNARTGVDLRHLLRSGMSDEELRQALQQAIYCKPQEHHFKAASYEEKDSRAMYQVGG